MTSWRPRNRHA